MQMNRFLQRLLLHERLEIETKLSEEQIHKRLELFNKTEWPIYYALDRGDKFYIAEISRKHWMGISETSPFPSMAKARIRKAKGGHTISVVLGLDPILSVVFLPLYFFFMITLILFPVILLILKHEFWPSLGRLKEQIINLFT